jgi:hypothetical protein
MQCRRCEELLFESSERPLEPTRRAAVDSHLAECPTCSALARTLQPAAAHDAAADADFTAAVLELTTAVAPVERAQRQLDRDLPALATLAPDDEFVADVMAATVEIDRRRFLRRAAAAWAGLVQRPRFALEGAYLGSIAAFLLVGMPWSPLAGVPEKVLSDLREEGQVARSAVVEGAQQFTRYSRVTLTRAGDEFGSRIERVLPDGLPLISDATEAPRWREVALEWLDSLIESIVDLGSWLVGPWVPSGVYETAPPSPAIEPDNEESRHDRSSHSA